MYKGPSGILRASHRAFDEARLIHPNWPFHPHDKQQNVAPGMIVRLDIDIWAMGFQYESGECLRVNV